MASLRPETILPFIGQMGVSMSTSSSGMSRVTSYPIRSEISLRSSLKSLEPVSLSLMIVSLCWTMGWLMTCNWLILKKCLVFR